MAKLGEQLQIDRPTRTQRLIAKREYEKEIEPYQKAIQEQQQKKQETTSKIQKDLDVANKDLQKIESGYREYQERQISQDEPVGSSQTRNYQYSRGIAQAKVNALNQALQQSQKGLIDYGDVSSFVSKTVKSEERASRGAIRHERERQKIQDQSEEIASLKAQGYTPQVIEKSFKGDPKAVDFAMYNPTTRQWRTITQYKVTAPVGVAGYERLGFSDKQLRTIQVGGKDYQFKSGVGIYKDPKGEIVTPFGRTGITQADIQQKALEEWKAERVIPDAKFPFKVITDAEDIPIGSAKHETISTLPSAQIIYTGYTGDALKGTSIFTKAWTGLKSTYKFIDERIHLDLSGSKMPKLSLTFGKREEPTLLETGLKEGDPFPDLKKRLQEEALGKSELDKFEKDLEEDAQERLQFQFEEKYMEDIIKEKITFAEAEKEFKESTEAKKVIAEYQQDYSEGYQEMSSSVPFKKWVYYGTVGQGLRAGSFLYDTFQSPTRTVVTAGAVYTGVKTLSVLPRIATTGLNIGLFAHHTYKVLSPTSTFEERAGGLLIATLTGIALGYGAYKHLRTPVVKTVKISVPKVSAKASSTIGRDVKRITDKGTVNRVIFQNQKLSQTVQAGRRTIVTTKWREFARSFWHEIGVPPKFTENYIYRGVPTQQLGKVYEISGVRGDYSIRVGASGYQRATKLLKEYGWTSAQAKATLRYYAPRITEQFLSEGVINVQGNKAIGEMTYLTEKKVIDIDKSLGIKTRGGRTIKDVYNFERQVIDYKGSNIILEQRTKLSLILKDSGRLASVKKTALSKSVIFGKASDLKKAYEIIGRESGVSVYKDVQYKELYGLSVNRDIFPSSKILKIDASKTLLIDDVIDLTTKGKYVRPFGVKKTPFSKTFGDQASVNKVVDKLTGSSKSIDVQKVVDKIDKVGGGRIPPSKVSEFYGTGQYEKTFGVGATPDLQTQQFLKSTITAEPVKSTILKDIINVKLVGAIRTDLATLTAVKVASDTKQDLLAPALKSALDINAVLKGDLMIKSALKVGQTPTQAQITAQRTAQRSILDVGTFGVSTPMLIPIPQQKIPDVTPTHIPPALIVWFKAQKKRKKRLKGSMQTLTKAYLPDFTSRALGLDPEVVTGKQAQKRIKKLLTGLEIRRGVRIK